MLIEGFVGNYRGLGYLIFWGVLYYIGCNRVGVIILNGFYMLLG